jgi:DNA-binding transcriptional ArsR family regulator
MRSSAAGKAPIFFALGDETRLGLVSRLSAGGAQSIARLTEGTDVTRQAVTKHLRILSDVGLVRGVRHGRESLWELQPRKLDEARRYLDQISAQWDSAIERLRMFVEE